MSKWIPWFILGVLTLFLLLSYRYYAASVAATPIPYTTTDVEAFTAPSTSATIRGDLRECTVYYTSNVDICNREIILTPTETEIDADRVNYYTLGKDTVNQEILRINAIPTETRTATQTTALANLKRVLADIDTLPFKNTCKLEMTGLKESTAHPRKTNTDDDGTNRRGNPLHWAFCYYNTTTPPIPPAVRAEPVFTRVFQDTTVTDMHPTAGAHRRMDMKSMYNDDLLNLHCRLYETSLEGGGGVAAFNNTPMLELTLVASEVRTLATAPADADGKKRLTITRMRPVRVLNGVLVADTNAATFKQNALSLIELVRTQTAFVHRQKAYNPTLYKMLFHLCAASPKVVPADTLANAISRNYIQLMVPKPLNAPITTILRLKPAYIATHAQIYDFYTQPPRGDISDMTIHLDTDIDNYVSV